MFHSSKLFLTSKKYLFLGFLIAILSFNTASAQSCSADLSVAKDRHVKSAYSDDPASFTMVLKNTSSKTISYTIATRDLKESCATKNKQTKAPNVSLDVEIELGGSSRPVAGNAITLRSGETRNFTIYASVPPKTPYNTWSCIEVSASADECSQVVASTILSVFVPEPSDG